VRRLQRGNCIREGADVGRNIDRSRYDFLSSMVADGVDIGPEATTLLTDIHERWPQWHPKPAEQAGFHIWHEGGFRGRGGGADKLKDVPDNELVAKARDVAAKAAFMEGDSWEGLCLSDPDRALRGLDAAAMSGDWPKEYWEQLLWSQTAYTDARTETKISELLLQWPGDDFDAVAAAASSWLHGHAKTLSDSQLLPLWDRIADSTLIETEDA
jgi:hypothetical protein